MEIGKLIVNHCQQRNSNPEIDQFDGNEIPSGGLCRGATCYITGQSERVRQYSEKGQESVSGTKEVAGHEVAGFDFKKRRFVLFTTLPVLQASRREPAPFWRIDRADHIALQNDLLCVKLRIRNRHGC